MRASLARPYPALAALLLTLAACRDTTTEPGLAYPPGPSIAPKAPPSKLAIGCPPACPVSPRILFSDTTGAGTVYSINPDGTGLQLEMAQAVGGSWMPSFKNFLYASHAGGPVPDLFLSPTTRGGSHQLTTNGSADYDANASPDGTQLVFTSDRDYASLGMQELYVMPTLGTEANIKRLTLLEGGDRWAHWSPNGQYIVFASQHLENVPGHWTSTYHIWRMNADGTNQFALNLAIEGRHPVYSPDGTRIAFTTRVRDGSNRIAVMNASGSLPVVIANGLTDSMEPSWSTDGKRIAFASNDPAWRGINTMNADGTNVQHVYSGGSRPKWSR